MNMIYRKYVQSSLTVCGLFALLACSGCTSLGTYNAATERSEFIFISTSEEVRMGQQIHQKLEKEYVFSDDEEIVGRVKRVGEKLAQLSDRQDYVYQFYVVEKDEFNAFTIPGGRIYIFTGLLKKMETDDQLASVLAHEIGHCAAKHTIKKFQAALGYDFLGKMILSQLGGQTQQVLNLSSGVITNLVFSAYGRKAEYQADKLGLKYMYLGGFDLNGMSQMFEVLDQKSQGNTVPGILKSHPHLKDRIKAAKNEIFVLNSRYN